MNQESIHNPLEKVLTRRKRKMMFRSLLRRMGRYMPFYLKRTLAGYSSKLSYLLIDEGELILNDYLDIYRMKINAKYEIQRVLLSRSYEPDVLAVIRKHVKCGDCCIDVGANVGAIAFAMAKQVGQSGQVICFEPGPEYAARLKENIKLNSSLENVIQVHQMGLSNQNGTLFWREDDEFPGNAGLTASTGKSVPVTTLDHFLLNSLPKLNFIKVDVEGMEWEMLTGAKQSLEKFHPMVLFETRMEIELSRGLPVLKMTEEFLRSLGYELFKIDNDGRLSKATYPNYSPNTLAVLE